jgi:hypothetical protein
MRRKHQLITTIWTSLLACPIVFVLIAMARLRCGEMDPCPTGGRMPYAGTAIIVAAAILVVQAAFLVMIWKQAED